MQNHNKFALMVLIVSISLALLFGFLDAQADSIYFLKTGNGGNVTSLDDLSDVIIVSPVNGSVIKYNGSYWIVASDLTTNNTITHLDNLTDVAIINPLNNQVIRYNSTSGLWYNTNEICDCGLLTLGEINVWDSYNAFKGGGEFSGSGIWSLKDNITRFFDNSDTTKRFFFVLDGLSSGNTRNYDVPDFDADLIGAGSIANDIGTRQVLINSTSLPVLQLAGENSVTGSILEIYRYGANPNIGYFRAQGTQASPSAVASGNVIGANQGNGYDGTSFATGANFRFATTQAWNSTAHGSQVQLRCVQNNSVTVYTCFVADQDGSAIIGLSQRLKLTDSGLTAQRTITFPDVTSKALTEDSALYKFFSKSSDPSTTDIPAGYCATYKNTTTAIVKYWCNDAGTLKGSVLT